MQVKLEKTVPVPAPAGVAWQVLQDIPEVASCLPGAQITEQVDAAHYKGRLRVKLGPASAEFKGDIEVKGVDAEKRELRLLGKGSEVKGTSAATMDLTASLKDKGDGTCELTGVSEISMTGKLASFGGRMMTQVAEQVMGQFAGELAAKVATRAGRDVDPTVRLARPEEAVSAVSAPAPQPAPQPVPEKGARELNALALLWAVLVGFVKGLFARKPGKPAS